PVESSRSSLRFQDHVSKKRSGSNPSPKETSLPSRCHAGGCPRWEISLPLSTFLDLRDRPRAREEQRTTACRPSTPAHVRLCPKLLSRAPRLLEIRPLARRDPAPRASV